MLPWFSYAFVAAIVVGPTLVKNWLYLSTLKGIIANQRRVRMELRPGSPASLPNVNLNQIEAATAELDALGFETMGDYLSRIFYDDNAPLSPPIAAPGAPPIAPQRFVPQGWARFMVHHGHGCVAKIIYSVSTDRTGARAPNSILVVSIGSYSGVGPNDWHYFTSNTSYNATARAISSLWRHPRRLGRRVIGANPAQLLQLHLARRAEVARAAGISWKKSLSVADNLAVEESAMENMRAVARGLTPLGMASQLWSFRRESGDEWLGELKNRL